MRFFSAFILSAIVQSAILLCSRGTATAATYYVAQSNPNPAPPYTTWATAATNIQDAINAAANGDQIIVTNGAYAYGGMAMVGTMTNRVCLNKPLTVQSVNGPFATIIYGAGATNGPNAVRCAWLTNGASLVGFTLEAGATESSGNTTTMECGGGVWCASSAAVVANCAILTNTCAIQGGGSWLGSLQNCFISGNTSDGGIGGGAVSAILTSCTVVSNSYEATYNCTCTNCILYYNSPAQYSGTFAWCCLPANVGGVGNITNAPHFQADGIHLVPASPCTQAGTNYVTGTDIFGNPWLNPPSIGCAEAPFSPQVSTPTIQLTSSPVGFSIGNAVIFGEPPFNCSWLQNGVPLSDNGHFRGTQTTNLSAAGVSFSDAAGYQLVVSNAYGVVTSAVVSLVVHCVAASGSNPTAPYLSWTTAATNIQDAINSGAAGDVVLVTNGIYAHGGISMDGVITNRISLNKAILVLSVNGSSQTIVQGAWDSTFTNGPGALRCAWLTNNALLEGFTLQGGATRGSGSAGSSICGGGVYCTATNVFVGNCQIVTNCAYSLGGGAYFNALSATRPTFSQCTLYGNQTTSSQGGAGGAYGFNLLNCFITANIALDSNGGGTMSCNATNCAYTFNSSILDGGAAYEGTLINCTVSENTSSGYSPGYGAAVSGATLVNCIVYGNFSRTSYASNYASCTMTYCDASPLASGTGNTNVNPQFLADDIHLAATSPCIGAGTSNVVSGTDIDGQPWNTPPAIGCDQWQPAPLIFTQPSVQINSPAHGLTVTASVAGQTPLGCIWTLNGTPIQDDGHYVNSSTSNLIVNNFGPEDAGIYQVLVTNEFGAATSQVAQVVIHVVNAAGTDPAPPYSTWETAATNIQDAVNSASAGDIVLVTNGVYAYGGEAVVGNLTNRVALTFPLTVVSANGYAASTIQGAWDPAMTNGPAAVRCAYVANGASLIGFTLQNGATRATGDSGAGGPLESGGGVYSPSKNAIIANCLVSNNCAIYGAGVCAATVNGSLLAFNRTYLNGGGAYGAVLYNCTVANNTAYTPVAVQQYGAGVYSGFEYNCIVINNYDISPYFGASTQTLDNYPQENSVAYFTCTSPTTYLIGGSTGNINVQPQLLDLYHLAAASPCRGAGSVAYASGTDLDGQPWTSPPSMGCSEVVVSNLVGPLSVSLLCNQTNILVNRPAFFAASFKGRATAISWTFGDGGTASNSVTTDRYYFNPGQYTLTYTAYNNDNPAGVSVSTNVIVSPIYMPLLQSSTLVTNHFQFQFVGQNSAEYTIQYATNLVPPVVWNSLQMINFSSAGTNIITDPTAPTGTRFYRVEAQ